MGVLMSSYTQRTKIAVLVCSLVLTGVCTAQSDPLSQAQSLLDAKQPDAAYDILQPLADDQAGTFQFDYLFGIAALDSGHALDAVLALERAVDAEPQSGPARAELARAYATLGESGNAKREFERLKSQDLPAEVSRRVDQYLAAIQVLENRTQTKYRPFVQVGLGYDTNVNSATDASRVAVPAFGGVEFNLTNSSRELDSAIWDLAAGVSFTSPLNPEAGLSLYGSIALDHRLAVSESDFTSRDAGGTLGLHLLQGRHQFRIGAEAQHLKVDGGANVDSDREVGGMSSQWQYSLTDTSQVTAFLQYSMVRYPEQRVRNVNRVTGGVGYAHVWTQLNVKPVVFISAFGGNEDAQNETRGEQFGRQFYGARVGAQASISPKGTVFAGFTWQSSEYDREDPVFLDVRDDDFVDLNAGYRHQLNRQWSVTPTLRYNNNDSNIATSEYDRIETMLLIRNDF